jgi:hypothetical protein
MAEILGGHFVRDDNRVGILKGCIRTAVDKRKGEHGEKRGIHEVHVVFVKHHRGSILGLVFEGACRENTVFIDPRVLNEFGKFIGKAWGQGIWNIGIHDIVGMDDSEKVKVILVGVEFVIAQLILDPECDQDETGHPHSQSKNVDQCKNLVSDDVTECDLKIVADHGKSPVQAIFDESGDGFDNFSPEPSVGLFWALVFSDVFIGFFKISEGIIIIFCAGQDLEELDSKKRG